MSGRGSLAGGRKKKVVVEFFFSLKQKQKAESERGRKRKSLILFSRLSLSSCFFRPSSLPVLSLSFSLSLFFPILFFSCSRLLSPPHARESEFHEKRDDFAKAGLRKEAPGTDDGGGEREGRVRARGGGGERQRRIQVSRKEKQHGGDDEWGGQEMHPARRRHAFVSRSKAPFLPESSSRRREALSVSKRRSNCARLGHCRRAFRSLSFSALSSLVAEKEKKQKQKTPCEAKRERENKERKNSRSFFPLSTHHPRLISLF